MKYLLQKKNRKQKKNEYGFTLVEMMVSVAIFAMVVTAGMGALMTALGSYRFTQERKNAADSINYVLENLTREVRLGSKYYVKALLDSPHFDSTQDGMIAQEDTGELLGFRASDNRGYMIYFLKDNVFYRRLYPDFDAGNYIDEALTDKEQVIVKKARVTVMNAEDPLDQRQPLVWIQLQALTPKTHKLYVIQTLASQRALDVEEDNS